MKLVRPLGIEPLNDESEPYPSKGLCIPVGEMHAGCTQCVRYVVGADLTSATMPDGSIHG
jgi:hypothetical protein